MNKSDLIAAVAQAAGVQKKDAERVVNASLDIMTAALAKGEKVQLSGFGTYEVKARKDRVGRNPVTRESVKIPAKNAVTFKPSGSLKEKVEK
jgi:DNA-binding protein HU-beta